MVLHVKHVVPYVTRASAALRHDRVASCDKVRTVLCEDTLWTYGLGDSYVIRRVAGYERLKHAT